MGWVHDVPADDLYDHEGYTVACAADGTQLLTPENSSSVWWAFDGTKGYPLAERVKAACECGWRATKSFPLDWTAEFEVTEGDEGDTGPYHQWAAHIDSLRADKVPTDVTEMLSKLDARLKELSATRPLVAVQISRRLETSGAHWLAQSVKAAKDDGSSWTEVGKALGTSKQNAHERWRRLIEN